MNRFSLFSAVLPSCGHPAPDMTLRFVVFQNAAYLMVQLWIYVFQPFGDVFMYRAFAYAEFARCTAHRRLVFYNVFAEFYRTVFNNAFQWAPPLIFYFLYHAYENKRQVMQIDAEVEGHRRYQNSKYEIKSLILLSILFYNRPKTVCKILKSGSY